MSDNREQLRERLLSQEQINPVLHSKYKEEMEKMFIEKLSAPKAAGTFILSGLRLLIGLVQIFMGAFDYIPSFGFIKVPNPLGIPFVLRILLVSVGLVLVLLSLKGLDLVRRGEYDRNRDVKHIAWLKASLGYAAAILVMVAGSMVGNFQLELVLFTMALVFLVISALPLLFEKINRADLDTRQKLLEIELRLVALDERLGGREPKT